MKHRLVQYCTQTYQWLQRVSWLRYTLGVTLFLTFMATVFVVLPAVGVHADETGNAAVDSATGFFQMAGIDSLLTFGAMIIMGITHLIMGLALFFLNFFIVLAGYNGFIDTPIVQIGWTMVRDLSNMFFIVALLVIAFAQILGREEYALKKTMGKLVLMAILVNFSLLISQLFIDVAHVVTMTFLNAIVATAGGNFINMFKFNEVSRIMTEIDVQSGGQGRVGLELFLTSILSVFMSIGAMITIGVYAVMMLVRIVMLWVLLVLSPFSYALAALPATQKTAQDWWNEFTKNVMSAPLIVFFLWLAFATLGNGAILAQVVDPGNNSLSVSRNLGEESDVYLGQQDITLSEASTWENMGSFAVAVALLWAGIAAVQQLGVMGAARLGMATSVASGFAKRAAFLGTGLFAASWGASKVGGAAKDYGKIIGARADSGIRNSRFGGAYGKIADMGKRRQAAVSKAEEYRGLVEQEVKAKGGGLGAKLGVQRDTIARQTFSTTNAQTLSENKKRVALSNVKTAEEAKQTRVFNERMEAFERQNPGATPAQMQAARASAAQGLSIYEAGISNFDATDVEKVASENIAKALNKQRIGQLKSENKALERKKEKVDEELIKEMIASGLSKEELNPDIKDELQKTAEGDADDLGLTGNARTDYIREKLGDEAFQEEVKKKLVRATALKKISTEDRANAYIAAGVFDGLRMSEAAFAEQSARTKTGKAESESKLMGLRVMDIIRGTEGKRPDEEMNAEISKINENLQEFAPYGYDRTMQEIEDTFAQIQRYKQLAKTRDLDDDEKQILKNRSQQMMQLVAHSYNKGWGSLLGNKLARLDDSFKEQDMNDPENIHMVTLALANGGGVGGADFTTLRNAKSASKMQETLRKTLGDKGGILFRTVQTGLSLAAERGQAHLYAQMGDGRDALGKEMIGFTNIMRSGIGDGTIRLGNGQASAGPGHTRSRIVGEVLADFTSDSSDDGRVFVKTFIDKDGNEIAQEIRKELYGAVMGIVQKSADQIAKMSTPKLNFISGGDYDNSSYDKKTGKFEFHSEKMREAMLEIHDGFMTRIEQYGPGPSAGKDRAIEAMRAFYAQLGMDTNGLSVDRLGDIERLLIKRI